MSISPPDQAYVTGDLPAEMRQGIEPGDLARPTGQTSTEETVDIDGTPTTLTRILLPRPDNIPAGAPKLTPLPNNGDLAPMQRTLSYDFPLLPGVQCRVMFQGEVTGDHLEQLLDYLTVACKRLRTQQERDDAVAIQSGLKELSHAERKTISGVSEVRRGNGRHKPKVLPRSDANPALPAQSES